MRKTLVATGLAAAALVAGAGAASAQTTTDGIPCRQIGEVCLVDVEHGTGWNSVGLGSLAGLLEQAVLAGSNALSLQLPIGTGSYAPGSFGSYGPEGVVGQLSAAATGSLIQGSLGS